MLKRRYSVLKNKQNIKKWYIYFLAVLSMVGFWLTPMTGDLKVFFSGANQASYISENLVIGAYKQWELKGVFSRLLIYAFI